MRIGDLIEAADFYRALRVPGTAMEDEDNRVGRATVERGRHVQDIGTFAAVVGERAGEVSGHRGG